MRLKMFGIILVVLCLSKACPDQYSQNQDRALVTLRSIRTAQVTFKAEKGYGRYGSLEELIASGLLNSSLAGGVKDGYKFKVKAKGASYEAIAEPIKYGAKDGGTGSWSFYLDESGVIRGAVDTEATVNDAPVRYQ